MIRRYFRAACTTLLFAGVRRAVQKINWYEYGPGDATGKVVMVSLKVGIPPTRRAYIDERIYRR